MKVVIVGGGAAGFFAAFSCKNHHPESEVIILEKSQKTLSKVAVSGGGRCNVTHHCLNIGDLVKNYPRGGNFLKSAFHQFMTADTIAWFEERGVLLKVEPDGRMFPVTNSSQTIIDCFLKEKEKLGIQLFLQKTVKNIEKQEDIFIVHTEKDVYKANKVIITTGGFPKIDGFNFIQQLHHSIESPIPSLFTFNMPLQSITELSGVVVQEAKVKIRGSKFEQKGPILITHWGMSGPAILKLSAWSARFLAEKKYQFEIQINWLGDENEDAFRKKLPQIWNEIKKRNVVNRNPFGLPNRFWNYLVEKSGIDENTTWENLSKQMLNKLINHLFNDVFEVSGKTTFKEEFVTCGGVSLDEVSSKTMESKIVSGFYFAGEVLDIDAVTGGFNFQAAWTTGFIAGKLNCS
jgi:predicted Rossmann fold flavoprotein